MTVAELIKHLQTFPQDAHVIFSFRSEYSLLEPGEISLGECQPPRPDGYVHESRPDKPRQTYVIFPGN